MNVLRRGREHAAVPGPQVRRLDSLVQDSLRLTLVTVKLRSVLELKHPGTEIMTASEPAPRRPGTNRARPTAADPAGPRMHMQR